MFRFLQNVFRPQEGTPGDPAQQFQDEYPLSLAGRLEYLEERLHLKRSQILNFAGAPAGFSRDPAVRMPTWEDLLSQQAPEHLEQLAAIEAAIVDYLADVGYDLTAATAALAEME